jgi:GntR family transcriptional regulator, rspAB operon transcriptional repressor
MARAQATAARKASPRRSAGGPSLTDRVFAELREEILRGKLKPGAIVNEPGLAHRYGVSKTPIREALRLLAQTGWVTVIPRRGYLVRPLALDDIREIFALRRMLEPPLAAECARRAEADGMALLRDAVDRHKVAESDLDALIEAAHDFHVRIATLSGNTRAAAIVSQLADEVNRLLHLMPRLEENLRSVAELEAHSQILEAIEAGESDQASELMEAHLRVAGRGMAEAFIEGN